jgi:hypothetical protein
MLVPQQRGRHATMLSPFSPVQERALAILVAAGGNGLTQQFLAACDLGSGTVAALIEKGFASLTHEKAQGGSIVVGKIKITEAGREALGRQS